MEKVDARRLNPQEPSRVKQLIKREFEIDIPLSKVRQYLKKWEFTSKKHIKRLLPSNLKGYAKKVVK